ncbi:hypothetical protein AB0L26_24005 [Streptomyces nondiastaticus]|uniref:hypothetical protein n=1 Tax=Streptomyces nondiastaticus TaxID=3154512 RepID=UPI003444655E
MAAPAEEPGPWVRDAGRLAAMARLMTGRGSRLHDYIRSNPPISTLACASTAPPS